MFCLTLSQSLPHEPQLLLSVSRLAPQPLLGLPSQSPQGEVHTGVQTPLTQEVVPCGLVHAVLQAPQWLSSFPVSTQTPPHSAIGHWQLPL
jgi:hypothetical protein